MMGTRATAGIRLDHVLSSLIVLGEREVDCFTVNSTPQSKALIDFHAFGGAIFDKSMAIGGNFCLSGSVIGNLVMDGNSSFQGDFMGNIIGDTVVDGDLIVSGNLDALDGLIANLESDIICVNDELQADLIVPKTPGGPIEIGNVIIDDGDITANSFTVSTFGADNLSGNSITGNTLTITGDACFGANVQTDFLEAKTMGDPAISITGNLIPSGNLLYDLGSDTLKWNTLYVNDVVICGQLLGNVSISNIGNLENLEVTNLTVAEEACFNGNVLLDNLISKSGNGTGDILVGGNLVPTAGNSAALGSELNKWETLWVNDIVVCGQLSGNVNIDLSNVDMLTLDSIQANTISTTDLIVDELACFNGNIQVDEILSKTGNIVQIEDITIQSNTITANVMTTSILEVDCLHDYNRVEINSTMYMATGKEDIIAVLATATLGSVTVVLPEISTLTRSKKRLVIVDEGGHATANAICVMSSGSDMIFNGTFTMISGDFNAIQFYSNGTNTWFAF